MLNKTALHDRFAGLAFVTRLTIELRHAWMLTFEILHEAGYAYCLHEDEWQNSKVREYIAHQIERAIEMQALEVYRRRWARQHGSALWTVTYQIAGFERQEMLPEVEALSSSRNLPAPSPLFASAVVPPLESLPCLYWKFVRTAADPVLRTATFTYAGEG